jgi:hypothetical protein
MANADTILAGSTSANNVTLRNDDTGSLTILKDAAQIFKISPAGHLSIGYTTLSPWNVLSSSKVIEMPGGSIYSVSNSSVRVAQNMYNVNGVADYYVTTAAASRYAQEAGEHSWYIAPSGTAGNAITWNKAMTLNTDGDLILKSNYGYNQLILNNTAAPANAVRIRSNNQALEFVSGAGVSATLYANGNLQVPAMYNNTSAAGANVVVGTGGDLYRSTSALKYKQDIRDLEDIDLNSLRPVRYKSKCESDDQTKDHIGFIADEADANGWKELVNYNENGEVEGFQYERVAALLWKKCQTLEARLAALEGAK